MKRILFSLCIAFFFTACDDGEILVTSFDFEDSTLNLCSSSSRNVIYAINSADVNESISLEFSGNVIPLDEDGNIIPPEDGEDITFTLSNNNRIIYRLYSTSISDSYFCSTVPPSDVRVTEEWISGSGAIVTIGNNFLDETGTSDPDGDGLNNNEEGWDPDGIDHQDSDEDGIPDYLDRDDDNDNVYTRNETANDLSETQTEDGYPDTDEDGIPNYLDPDDDGDGVLTRFEVTEDNPTNPTIKQTAEGISDYLNPQQTGVYEHQLYLDHNITRRYGFNIVVNNLKFTRADGSGESIMFDNYNFGTLRSSSITVEQCPSMAPDCDADEVDPEEGEEEPETQESN